MHRDKFCKYIFIYFVPIELFISPCFRFKNGEACLIGKNKKGNIKTYAVVSGIDSDLCEAVEVRVELDNCETTYKFISEIIFEVNNKKELINSNISLGDFIEEVI